MMYFFQYKEQAAHVKQFNKMFQVLCAATKFAQKIDELALKPEFWLNWITMHMRHYGVKDFLKLKGKKRLKRG